MSLKALRSYAGSANHVANLLFVWRPFLDALWAASAQAADGKKRTNAPPGMLWTEQVRVSLQWIWWFLECEGGPLHREWTVRSYFQQDGVLMMILDASPWGLGGILLWLGKPIAWFTSPLTEDDVRIHKFELGDHRGQQAWECLTVLVAVKSWYDYWSQTRLTVCIKSDSKSALSLAERLKVGPTAKLISQELALLYHWAQFEPKVEHIPGVANQLADTLSRLNDPKKDKTLPAVLAQIPPTRIPARDEAYYMALAWQVG